MCPWRRTNESEYRERTLLAHELLADVPVHDVPREVLSASLVRPGSREGPFRVVYVLKEEAMSEVRNKMLKAYLVGFLSPVSEGYKLLLAVHVLPSTRWTALYLALISPFRRFLVYPWILRKVREEWQR